MQMNIDKFKLKGHRSFYLRDGWINKGLMNVDAFHADYPVDELGVGSAMVYSIRYYLKTMGLIEIRKVDRKNHYYLTEDLGQIIYDKDMYLEDSFTLWLLHYSFVRNIEKATSFSIFFNEFNYESFTKSELEKFIYNYIKKNNQSKNVSKRSIKSDVNVIIKNYNKKELNTNKTPEENLISPFTEIGLINEKKATNENVYEKNKPDIRILSEFIIYYVILDQIGESNSISIDKLESGTNSIGKIFNLDSHLLYHYLDKLEESGLIQINRAAGLNQVYVNKIEKTEVLEQYYDRGEVRFNE